MTVGAYVYTLTRTIWGGFFVVSYRIAAGAEHLCLFFANRIDSEDPLHPLQITFEHDDELGEQCTIKSEQVHIEPEGTRMDFASRS